ncbi:MarR family transcriptional regulator [Agrococcus sp. ARC_14]|uniref:MarR family transcriptional regulator n=1 Tax=Agrococcus sp. ARC_14 TaxID=2919927 RepID=UPI001F057D26|nr:MarR family transcriptional regulator [Agrococcus sp. ARC_14]MCH1884314.1 MarR family transcriptional regulator [Agrococcus sp. ARC_14]
MTSRLALSLASLVESGQLLARLSATGGERRIPAVTSRAIAVLASEGPMGVTALARRCHVSQPTMTEMVRDAIAAGWIRRLGPNARPKLVPTPEAVSQRIAQREAAGEALESRFTRLGARERATLERAAMILASALEAEHG